VKGLLEAAVGSAAGWASPAEGEALGRLFSVEFQHYDMVPGRLDNDVCTVVLANGTKLEGKAIYNSATYADVQSAPLHEWQEVADADDKAPAPALPAIGVIFSDQGDRRFSIGGPNLLNDLRQSKRFTAYLFVQKLLALPDSDQVAMMNADPFNPPSGCLAVQLPASCIEQLRAACAAHEVAHISCQAAFVPASSANVVARAEGLDPTLPPVVVLTPRSGWGPCASERAPGLACLLEALRAVAAAGRPPRRPVVFAATSGHELGHLGLTRLMGDLGQSFFAWVHLGANLGSRLPAEWPVWYQASDAYLEQLLVGSLREAGNEQIKLITKIGEKPLGEVREVHEQGSRYVSLMAANPRFHHPTDTYPDAVDMDKTVRICRAVIQVVLSLTDMDARDLPQAMQQSEL